MKMKQQRKLNELPDELKKFVRNNYKKVGYRRLATMCADKLPHLNLCAGNACEGIDLIDKSLR